MSAKKTLPFGTWPSPLTPASVAKGSRRFGTIQAAGGAVYWSESRPEQGGRQVILRAARTGAVEEVLPLPFSARSRVHEYGGGEFLVAGETIYFVNDKDQQVYRLEAGAQPRRITDVPGTRFADFALDAARQRLIAVAEIHPREKGRRHTLPRNALVAIALSGKTGQITELAAGRDFYASPRLSPDGKQLAFLAWDLPDMPWDSATLVVARVGDDGKLGRPRKIAGGDGSAAFQPEWGPDGRLYFVWDKTGWGQLYRWQGNKIVRVHGARGAELARPQWVFGSRSYALDADGRVGMVSLRRGLPLFEVRDLKGGKVTQICKLQNQTARIDDPVAFASGFAALIGPTDCRAGDHANGEGRPRTACRRRCPTKLRPASSARARCASFAAPTGRRCMRSTTRRRAPPTKVRPGSAPPALVLVHGGPTSMTDAGFKPRVQFYTSRGFAVLDVNYSGSTGYGRAYRQRLDGAWGIADVVDCAAGARHLAKAGLADGARIAIAGGSAGGYTTLMALATTNVFAAGSSHYGVSDLGLLLEHTHKFESGYLHRLMGTTPAKWQDVFAARSPINLIEGITAPVILFQGLDDKVVPPEQSRLIVEQAEAPRHRCRLSRIRRRGARLPQGRDHRCRAGGRAGVPAEGAAVA